MLRAMWLRGTVYRVVIQKFERRRANHSRNFADVVTDGWQKPHFALPRASETISAQSRAKCSEHIRY